MPYFKESSGGQPAGRFIEAKSNYGPMGAEAVDVIDPQVVLNSPNVVTVTQSSSFSIMQWILLIVAILFLIFVIVQVASRCCENTVEKQPPVTAGE